MALGACAFIITFATFCVDLAIILPAKNRLNAIEGISAKWVRRPSFVWAAGDVLTALLQSLRQSGSAPVVCAPLVLGHDRRFRECVDDGESERVFGAMKEEGRTTMDTAGITCFSHAFPPSLFPSFEYHPRSFPHLLTAFNIYLRALACCPRVVPTWRLSGGCPPGCPASKDILRPSVPLRLAGIHFRFRPMCLMERARSTDWWADATPVESRIIHFALGPELRLLTHLFTTRRLSRAGPLHVLFHVHVHVKRISETHCSFQR